MKMPRASPAAVKLFGELAGALPTASVRKMFGQPAAFVNGNMFLGVFGGDVFLVDDELHSRHRALLPL